jgi:hypothetical protein
MWVAATSRGRCARISAAIAATSTPPSGVSGACTICTPKRFRSDRKAIWLEMKSLRVVRMTSPASNGIEDKAVAYA